MALTTAELAESIGVNERTVRMWRKNGTGPPFYRVNGGIYLYPTSLVEQWLQGGAGHMPPELVEPEVDIDSAELTTIEHGDPRKTSAIVDTSEPKTPEKNRLLDVLRNGSPAGT